MSEYIRTNKFDTNECPNIFVKEKLIRTNVRIYIRDQYIRIFEYIRHTLIYIYICHLPGRRDGRGEEEGGLCGHVGPLLQAQVQQPH